MKIEIEVDTVVETEVAEMEVEASIPVTLKVGAPGQR